MNATTKSSVKRKLSAFVAQNPAPTKFYNHVLMFMRKPVYAALAIVLCVVMLSGGTVYASQEALPGEPLYNVKLATEAARTKMTRDEQKKAELHLKHAQRRVDELQKLISAGTVTPELVTQTQELLMELVSDIDDMASTLDPELGLELAVSANNTSDQYVEVFADIPEDYREEYDGVAREVMGKRIEHTEDYMDHMLSSYSYDKPEVKQQILSEFKKEYDRQMEYIKMLEQGMVFAATIDSESAAFAKKVQAELSALKKMAAQIKPLLNDPKLDPAKIQEMFGSKEDAPDARDLFEKVEKFFNKPKYENLDYDGPWIGEEDHHFDPSEFDGDCHFTEDQTQIECMESGVWKFYEPSYFKDTLMPTGDYHFDGPEGSLDYEEDKIDNPQPKDAYPDQPGDEMYDLIIKEFDKDGDGEVDCIGEKGCPGPEFFAKIFNRDCGEDCIKMFDEYDEKMKEKKEKDHDVYEYGGDYDDDPNHFPPPGNKQGDDMYEYEKEHPDKMGDFDPTDPYENMP